MKAKHTALPWDTRDGFIVGGRDRVADLNFETLLEETMEANGELIVRAVNAHAALVEALKGAHGCATLRVDGTCDGCPVSAALELAEKGN